MNIFVGASSRNTETPIYLQAARSLGTFLVENHHNLVFGGCNQGLMGAVYYTILSTRSSQKKCMVIATQVEAYKEELETLAIDKLVLSRTVDERKDAFLRLADCLVFLPGGIGTIDEFMTALETKRCHQHDYPMLLVNLNYYFSPLLEMLNKTCKEGFASPANLKLFEVANTLGEMEEWLKKHCL